MSSIRRAYGQRLAALEDDAFGMGDRVLHMLGEATAALRTNNRARAEAVIRQDDVLDEAYLALQRGILTTLATQAPVARDLRLLTALLHINIHLERMGDLCVNIARSVGSIDPRCGDAELAAQIYEMSEQARPLIAFALDAFVRRDLDAARALPGRDEPLDRLNRGVFHRLVRLAAADERQLDWAMRMVLVARFLERLGDHAVDIGEQTIFAVTGEVVEFTDAMPLQ